MSDHVQPIVPFCERRPRQEDPHRRIDFSTTACCTRQRNMSEELDDADAAAAESKLLRLLLHLLPAIFITVHSYFL